MKTRLLLLLLLVASAFAMAGDYDHAVFRLAVDAQSKGRRTGHCMLHNRDMTCKTVPVVFGYNDVAKEDSVPADTRVRFFPHAAEFCVSAHVGEKHTPKLATAFICSDCQEVEKKWKQDHPKYPQGLTRRSTERSTARLFQGSPSLIRSQTCQIHAPLPVYRR